MLIAASTLELSNHLVCLWLHPATDPPLDEWSAVIQRIVAAKKRTGISRERVVHLVISDGGAPNTTERKELMDRVWEGHPGKIAAITSVLANPVKRGVATAIAWMNPSSAFFLPEEAHRAIAHLALQDQVHRLLEEFESLERTLGPNPTFRRVRKALQSRG